MFSRVKGTQDFLDLSLIHFILDQAKQHLLVYHFTEIATPIIESIELFKRSLGEETDVISKEMFIIKPKGEDEESLCLRPEATASLVRAFVENSIDTVPWKAYTYGPMFRYERPQKGRYRQFHQISMEIIGSKSPSQDVQLIKMLDRFFHEKLNLNNYALLLNYLGCAQDRQKYKEKLYSFLNSPKAQGICSLCQIRKETNILRIFDCKVSECQKMYTQAPVLLDCLCKECNQEWKQIQDELEMLSVSYSIKPTLVRGLDYYNKTVFEFASNNLGAQNAFCGGGRYDQLVSQIGGKEDQPSCGAAIGIERLALLLEPMKDSLAIAQAPALYLIVPLDNAQQPVALLLADELQEHHYCTDILFDGDSIKSKMKKAHKLGATYTLLIGADEQAKNEVTVKNMITGTQETISQATLIDYLKK